MPLINLQTDLKSFKYGHDRPGGGDSGQPFITTNIETGIVSANVASRNILGTFGINQIPTLPNIGSLIGRSQIGRAVNEILSGDEFIRGGAAGAAQASLNDTLRIGLFLTSVPKGPIFIAKQVGLQLSNPRLEVKKGLRGALSGALTPGGLLATITGGILEPTRIYNAGVNTIAQIPVNAFGGHFNRHGILPTQDDNTKYEAVVKFNNNSNNSRQNRLIELTDKFNLGEGTVNINPGIFNVSAAKRQVRKTNKANRRQYRQAVAAQTKAQQAASSATPPLRSSIAAPILPVSNPSNPILAAGASLISKPLRVKLDTTKGTISSYIGGPGSVYGIGLTIINRYEFTEDADKYADALTEADNNAGKGLDNSGQRQSPSFNEIVSSDIGEGTQYAIGRYKNDAVSDYLVASGDKQFLDPLKIGEGLNLGVVGAYKDLVNNINAQQTLFRYDSGNKIIDTTRNSNGVVNSTTVPYSVKNIGKIVYTNDYNETVIINKSTWADASRETRVGSRRYDEINLTPLFNSKTGKDSTYVTIDGYTYTINDLVKFRIEAIDTDKPSRSVFMVFRAYITDLSDDVSADWTDVKYAGRGEKFYIYNGFNRKINISFKVAALSAEEMEPMYQKLNYLMSNLMPDYSAATAVPTSYGTINVGGGLMRGPFVRMTIGNWVDSQPGIINSLTYKVPQDSPWEIALNEPITDPRGVRLPPEMILPHVVEVNLTFTPIGSQTKDSNETPRKVKNNDVSHIAQNYSGGEVGEPNYITGSVSDASYDSSAVSSVTPITNFPPNPKTPLNNITTPSPTLPPSFRPNPYSNIQLPDYGPIGPQL